MPKLSRNAWIVIIIVALIGAWWWFSRSAIAMPGGTGDSIATSSTRDLANTDPTIDYTRRYI